MIYSMVPFPVTLSDHYSRFQVHGVIIDALGILCVQLTRDLFAIANFLFLFGSLSIISYHINRYYVMEINSASAANYGKNININ